MMHSVTARRAEEPGGRPGPASGPAACSETGAAPCLCSDDGDAVAVSMLAIDPLIANPPSERVIGEREVPAEGEPMLKADIFRDLQTKRWRRREDNFNRAVLVG